MRFHARILVVVMTAVAAAYLVHAAEGRIPIFKPVVLDGDAGSITGRYVVVDDIAATAPAIPIRIVGTGTETLEIDLNGFTLTSATTAVIKVEGQGVLALVVRDGTLEMPNGVAGNILDIAGSSGPNPDEFVARNVRTRFGTIGMFVDGVDNVRLINNHLSGSGTGGAIVVQSTSTIVGRIERNDIRNISGGAITVSTLSRSMSIRDNIIHNAASGILLSKLRAGFVVGNSINNISAGSGIALSDCGELYVAKNSINQVFAGNGISLVNSLECLVAENLIGNSGEDGISVEGGFRHLLERNLATGNLGYGIHFTSTTLDNTYRGNTLRRNAVTSCSQVPVGQCAAPAVCDEATGNVSDGDNLDDSGKC